MANMKDFIEALEKKSESKNIFEDAYTEISAGGKKDWYYVPKQDFLNGILRVAVHEIADNKWEIAYCAPESGLTAKEKKGAKGLMANRDIERFKQLLNEEVEGHPNSLKGWTVKTKWSGTFEDCLKKCVDLVQGKSSGIPSGFKTK